MRIDEATRKGVAMMRVRILELDEMSTMTERGLRDYCYRLPSGLSFAIV